MAEHEHTDHAGEHHDEAHGSLGLYLTIGFALLILTLISFATPHFFADYPAVMRIIMIAVSCSKAMLVILFFMHVIWEANWKYVLTIPAACMSLFLMAMLVPDVGLRMRHATRERLLYSAIPQSAEHAEEEQFEETDHEDEDGLHEDAAIEVPGGE